MPLQQKHLELAQTIAENMYSIVPFIGENAFYYEEPGTSVRSYIIKRFLSEQCECHDNEYIVKSDGVRILLGSEDIHRFEDNYYGLTKMKKTFGRYFNANYIRYINEAQSMQKIHLREPIYTFLKEFDFPLIITNNCFSTIEEELKYGGYSSLIYKLCETNDILSFEKAIYHIFGMAQRKPNETWVNSEKELLYYLRSLNDEGFAPKSLQQYINDNNSPKKVLFLGCNLPNWIFRFVWSPFYKTYPEHKIDEYDYGYWLEDKQHDEKLEDFLRDVGYMSADAVDDILTESVRQKKAALQRQQQEHRILGPSHNYAYDIFISYASCDSNIMHRIKNILENEQNGLRVWCAELETTKGGDYWLRIQEGIENSRYFMPIVTRMYLDRFLNSDRMNDLVEESGLETETKRASRWLTNETSHPNWGVYSLPVIVLGQTFDGKEIGSTLVESYAKSAKNGIPQNMFCNIQMFFFSESADERDTFTNKDWSVYRNNNR